MSMKYAQIGNKWFSTTPPKNLNNSIPAGFYAVRSSMDEGFFLQEVEPFTINHKMYGPVNERTRRIMNTFNSIDRGMGVLLSGDKGSGKSLLAKNICIEAVNSGVPVFIVDTPYSGQGFNKFISDIHQEVVIFFDEFEKLYDAKKGADQDSLLTLFDGVYSSKRLFLLTVNNKFGVNDYMNNRPGRILYHYKYNGLDEASIREYCTDNLKDHSHIDRVVEIGNSIEGFSFDILSALIREMNLYNETPVQSLQHLNINMPKLESKYEIVNLEGLGIFKDVKFDISKSKQKFFNYRPSSLTDYHGINVHIQLPFPVESKEFKELFDICDDLGFTLSNKGESLYTHFLTEDITKYKGRIIEFENEFFRGVAMKVNKVTQEVNWSELF